MRIWLDCSDEGIGCTGGLDRIRRDPEVTVWILIHISELGLGKMIS